MVRSKAFVLAATCLLAVSIWLPANACARRAAAGDPLHTRAGGSVLRWRTPSVMHAAGTAARTSSGGPGTRGFALPAGTPGP